MKLVMKDKKLVMLKKKIAEKLHGLHNDLLFLPEKMKIEKVEKLVKTCMIKKNML